MKKGTNGGGGELAQLRQEAERILSSGKRAIQKNSSLGDRSLTDLFHEVQIYQVELEMQNDELREAQIQLEKEKQRVEGLFNLAPVSYLVLDDTAVIREFNESASALLLGKNMSLAGKRFQSFVHSASANDLYFFFRQVHTENRVVSTQLKLKSPRGSFFADLQGVAVASTQSGPQVYLAVTDVTEKKLAEIEIQEAAERLRLCLSASRAGTWQIDVKNGTVVLDSFAASLYGFTQMAFDGRYGTFIERALPQDRARLDEAVRAAIIQGRELLVSYVIMTPAGPCDIEARGHPSVADGREVFLGLITDVTERKRLESEAEELKARQQKGIFKAIMETEEKERQRISTALHDSVGQLLYATSLRLQHKGIDHVARAELSKLLDLAIQEARNVSFELAPSILNDFGLAVAIPEMVKRINSNNLRFRCNISLPTGSRLRLQTELLVFRIIQELLNNVIKHSGASEASLSVRRRNNCLYIKLRDNGTGFDTDKVITHGSGLHSIRNRLSLYHGTMRIASSKEEGTSIEIDLKQLEEIKGDGKEKV